MLGVRVRGLGALLAVVLLPGCASTVVGSASIAGIAEPQSAGPLTESRGDVNLDEAVDDPDSRIFDIAADPFGGFAALIGHDEGTGEDYLVQLRPGDDGPRAGSVRRVPDLDEFSRVFVAPDGTVVVAGLGYTDGEHGFLVAELAPGDDEATVHAVDDGLGETDELEYFAAALAPDGATLYVSFIANDENYDEFSTLAAVDVATGEVTATGEVGIDSPGEVVAWQLATGPDDGVSALVQVDRDAEGEDADTVLVRYGADLTPAGEPLRLIEDDSSYPNGLQITADGTTVATLEGGDPLTGDPTVVVVRDDEVAQTWSLHITDTKDAPSSFAVDPSGRYAYLPYETVDYDSRLVTLDLTTGEEAGTAPLCQGVGSFGYAALAADAQTLAVAALCDGNQASYAYLIG